MRLNMLMDWLSQYTGSKPQAVSVTKTTVSKTVPKDEAPEKDKDEDKPKEEPKEKVASANHLTDAYFDGFVKECEARGVDSTKLVGILLNDEENKNE